MLKLLEYYHERNDSTFSHDGKEYRLNIVFKLTDNEPIKMYPVDKMKWILKYKEEARPHIDISKPILVTKWHGLLVVLDGWHRLKKAVKIGKKELPGRMVTPEVLKQARI